MITFIKKNITWYTDMLVHLQRPITKNLYEF